MTVVVDRPRTAAPPRLVIGVVVIVAIIAVLYALPFMVGGYAVSTASRILVFGLLAVSVNLLTGITGLPVIGQAAYFGVGAYTGGIIAISLTPIGPVQVLAGAVGGALAALVSTPLVARARGVPFLMITLAIGEVAYTAAGQLRGLTGGTDGLSGIPAVVPFFGMGELRGAYVYFYVLTLFLIVFALVALLVKSPFGLVLRGIRGNEARLRAIGYPTTRYIVAVYTIAGGVAGAAGSLWTTAQGFMSPGDMGFQTSALALLAVVIGGAGSLWGPVVGGALVIITRDIIGGEFAGYGTLLLGALFIIAVYVLPKGVGGIGDAIPGLVRRKRSGSDGGAE